VCDARRVQLARDHEGARNPIDRRMRHHDNGPMGFDESPQAPDRYGELWADVYDDEHSSLVPPANQLSLLAELGGNGRVLELGIGTGRVALPLAARGVSVEGVDASPAMVARLRSKPGRRGDSGYHPSATWRSFR
jgi:SAM-dependent methyltransferase